MLPDKQREKDVCEDKVCSCAESSDRQMGNLSCKSIDVKLFSLILSCTGRCISGDVAKMCNLKPLRGSNAEQNKLMVCRCWFSEMLNLQKRRKRNLSKKKNLKFISIETKCKPFVGIKHFVDQHSGQPEYQGYTCVSLAET